MPQISSRGVASGLLSPEMKPMVRILDRLPPTVEDQSPGILEQYLISKSNSTISGASEMAQRVKVSGIQSLDRTW